jgi:hypothetical protein
MSKGVDFHNPSKDKMRRFLPKEMGIPNKIKEEETKD